MKWFEREAEPPKKFHKGQVVRHKAGGPRMVVVDYCYKQSLWCSWVRKDSREIEWFTEDEL